MDNTILVDKERPEDSSLGVDTMWGSGEIRHDFLGNYRLGFLHFKITCEFFFKKEFLKYFCNFTGVWSEIFEGLIGFYSISSESESCLGGSE